MSPEVAQRLPYNQSTDVYSFGILLWEICTAKKPYDGISSRDLLHKVVNAKVRPKTKFISPIPSKSFSQLMKQCWSHNPDERPDFSSIIKGLSQVRDCLDKI